MYGDGTGGLAARGSGTATAKEPAAIAFSDFNGDGHGDVATADYNSQDMSVALGVNGGDLASATSIDACGEPSGIAVGRFNADAFDDLAVSCYGQRWARDRARRPETSSCSGTGALPMSAMIPTGSGSMPNAINIGDFNGDSHLDVAAAGFGNGKCGAALGNGNGSFGPAQSITVGESPVAIAVGDVDHDGALDIVLADYLDSTTIDILHGDGSGGFAMTTVTVGMQPEEVAIADLDGDIVVASA